MSREKSKTEKRAIETEGAVLCPQRRVRQRKSKTERRARQREQQDRERERKLQFVKREQGKRGCI